MNRASGCEIRERNVAALRASPEGLQAAGEPLPTRNGRVNLWSIAVAHGFDRQTLYRNPAAKALLEEAVGRLGTGDMAAEEAEATPRTDRRDRCIVQLEQHNAALRAEERELREQLARYRHVEDVMIAGHGVRN